MASLVCTMPTIILLVVITLHGASAGGNDPKDLDMFQPTLTMDPAAPKAGDTVTFTCALPLYGSTQETQAIKLESNEYLTFIMEVEPSRDLGQDDASKVSGIFKIENAQFADSGTFSCKASDTTDFSYANEELVIDIKPAPTTAPPPTTPAPKTTPKPTTPAQKPKPTMPEQKPKPGMETKPGPMNPAEAELNCANDVVACTNKFYMTTQEIMDWYAFRECMVNIMPGCTKQDAMLWNVADQIRRAEQGTQVSDDAPRPTPALGVLLMVAAVVAAWRL